MATVMVLGGSSGIGAEVANKLDIELEHEVHSFGTNLDVRSESLLFQTLKSLQPTHIVYSVGINTLDWIGQINERDFLEVMQVNVWGFLQTVKCAIHALDQPASIVAVTSDAAWRPMRTSAAYCASKAALEMSIRVASRELAGEGWRINAVAPGKVDDTGMSEYVDRRVLELRGWTIEEAESYELRSSPISRKVTKEEVAQTIIAVLFGPAAMTGEVVAINGGR